MAEKNSDEDDGRLVYYYSREHRLSRASPQVRAFNEGSGSPGLVKRLVGSKGNIFLLVSVLMVFTMMLLGSRITAPSSFKLGENDIILSITRNEGGGLLLSLQKTIPKGDVFYTGYVDIAVSPVQKRPPPGTQNPPPDIMTERIFFTFLEDEDFSFPLPFDGNEFFVVLETEDERTIRRLRLKT